jgi:hypothetical protein
MSKPRVRNLLANYEKAISKNNEIGVSSGMYLTALLAKGPASNGVPPVSSRPATSRKKYVSKPTKGGASVDGSVTLETASICTDSQAESITDHDSTSHYDDASLSSQAFEIVDDNGYVWGSPITKTKKGIGKPPRPSPCGGAICPRRLSSISGNRGRKSLEVCHMMIPERIDEESDNVGFTVTFYRDICDEVLDDDTSIMSSTSFASGNRRGSVVSRASSSRGGDDDDVSIMSLTSFASGNRRGSVVSRASSSRGGDDDDKSVCSAFSRSSDRVRELPRDLEFDADADDSSCSESDSEQDSKELRKTQSKSSAPRHW